MFGFNFDRKTLYIIIGILVVMSLSSYGTDGIFNLILSIPAVLLAITVHEFGHAFAAYKLGDDTPLRQGRLTLNPMDHVDPLGIAMLLFAHIGWGKPVQVNPRNYNRNITVEKADAIVSFAGPLMNFITATIFALIYCALIKFAGITFLASNIGYIVIAIVASIVTLNIGLGVFNMIPLPPLDGSKIFLPVLPRNAKYWFIQHEHTFYIVFLIIWITGVAGSIISPIISQITQWILGFAMTIFGL
ncbi:MAG: site-2 protease family protein [Clostridia bacterium]|nr:site-2 protease family protein [Clostridia bacterium]